MSIVMGLDQHRAQITAEWLRHGDRRGRAGAGGAGATARRCGGFWRVSAARARGGVGGDDRLAVRGRGARPGRRGVHLAEPAETSALRGNKKRAKSDRADARHLRELLMVEPAAGVVDRARSPARPARAGAGCGTRSPSSAASGSSASRRCSITTAARSARSLMTGDGRAWLAAQPLPATAREQVTVALAMIDALEPRSPRWTRSCAPTRAASPGCKALMRHYGIGELTAVTILAELGDCTPLLLLAARGPLRRHGHHRAPVRSAPRARAPLAARDRPRCAGRCSRPPRSPARPGSPDRDYYEQAAERLGAQPRVPGDRAQAAQAQLPHAARARRGGARTRMTFPVRAQPPITPMRRGRLPACSRRHARVDGPERPSGRNASPSGITPSHIMSPARSQPEGRGPK